MVCLHWQPPPPLAIVLCVGCDVWGCGFWGFGVWGRGVLGSGVWGCDLWGYGVWECIFLGSRSKGPITPKATPPPKQVGCVIVLCGVPVVCNAPPRATKPPRASPNGVAQQ